MVIFQLLIAPTFLFAAVCKTTGTLTSHEHGCLQGSLLWSAPLGRNVDIESAKKYCSELPAVPDSEESWRLPTEQELVDLKNNHPDRSFAADLDNFFWSSGDFVVHPIFGYRVKFVTHLIKTDVICVLPYRKTPDCDQVNSIGMRFCRIPKGSFMMGSAPSDEGRYLNEGPQHLVTISKDFEMLSTEVTQKMWTEVCQGSCNAGDSPSAYGSSDKPVEMVSWNDITYNFLPKLRDKLWGDGYTYRLPSEAEWEYAARGKNGGRYGLDGDVSLFAWHLLHVSLHQQSVGRLLPNAFGLYDMHGNLWEWVQDVYANYPGGSVIDPVNSLGDGLPRVIRGGSYRDPAEWCRSAMRSSQRPQDENIFVGFRLVRTKN